MMILYRYLKHLAWHFTMTTEFVGLKSCLEYILKSQYYILLENKFRGPL